MEGREEKSLWRSQHGNKIEVEICEVRCISAKCDIFETSYNDEQRLFLTENGGCYSLKGLGRTGVEQTGKH